MADRPEERSTQMPAPTALHAVCESFRDAWLADPPAQLETYLDGWEDPQREELFCQLIRIDLEFRRASADTAVCLQDYCRRFPAYRDAIEAAMQETLRIRGGASLESEPPTVQDGQDPTEDPVPPRLASWADLGPGVRIDDFELVQRAGQGAFAVVYLARQQSMKRRVAVKISRRGRDEPQTLAQLDHPNIVRVFGVTHLPEQQLQLLCMEYVPGGTLQDVVARMEREGIIPTTGEFLTDTINQALSVNDEYPDLAVAEQKLPWHHVVCQLGAQLADALAHAHRKGVLHRDIKPANVLLGRLGSPKLADFNIAFSARVSDVGAAGYFGGTLAYMAPEQLEAFAPESGKTPEDVDQRSDLFSLAVLLWQLLTGRLPFDDQGDSVSTLQRAEVRRRGISPAARELLNAPHLVGVRDVLLRCLSADPNDRYQAASALARDLRVCTEPRVLQLMRPPQSMWLHWIYRHPLITTVLVSLLPNFLLSVANVLYDWFAIVQPLNAEQYFLPVMVTGKGLLYLLGILYGISRTWHIFVALRGSSSPTALEAARRDCLVLGDIVFGITLASWVVSGLLFPLLVDLVGATLTVPHYLTFFASHLLCGLISGDLAISALAFLSVRVFYPRLLVGDFPSSELNRRHDRLRRRLEIYSQLAVSVPILSVVALFFSLKDSGTNYWPAFLCLGVLGMLALMLGTTSKNEVRKDLDALDDFAELSERS